MADNKVICVFEITKQGGLQEEDSKCQCANYTVAFYGPLCNLCLPWNTVSCPYLYITVFSTTQRQSKCDHWSRDLDTRVLLY